MKALIAMSGGVDSSVSALLMQEKGYECIGVMMKLFECENSEKKCGTLDSLPDAQRIADILSIPLYVYDFCDEFDREVISEFVREYEEGSTPNPCILCNRHLKFDRLFEVADSLGAEKLVTGHYARVEYDDKSHKYLLKKGLNEKKDQSYVLYQLTQEKLARLEFPVGCMDKAQTREIAEKHGFINSGKKDSQDICFIPDKDHADFIRRYTGKEYPSGNFVDSEGRVLGRHNGIVNYTVGQRRGLGLSLPAPLYVCEKRISDNSLVLCPDKELYKSSITVKNVNLIMFDEMPDSFEASVRVRYHQKECRSMITAIGKGRVRIDFEDPQRAPAKGQSAVFYDGDTVIGGGIIE